MKKNAKKLNSNLKKHNFLKKIKIIDFEILYFQNFCNFIPFSYFGYKHHFSQKELINLTKF